MNRSYRISGAALALAVAQGAAVAAVTPDAAQDLMKKSGLWVQLESMSGQVRTGMANALPSGGDAQAQAAKARMLACAGTAYGVDAMRATATDAVAGTLQPADLPALLAWYDSPLGHKVSSMELASVAQVSDPLERLRRGNAVLATASAARKASLQAIVTETRTVDVMADTVIEMAIAVREGAASVDASTDKSAMGDIRARLQAQRPQLIERFGQMSLPAYAFTYTELGDEDLRRYADYLGSPAAKAYNDATVRSVARGLSDGSVRLSRCLKDAAAQP